MSLSVQQLLTDAKHLVSRLREHDARADTLISNSQNVNNNVNTMKQYHEELADLNAVAHQRPRSALILSIQQENRHIRELQQENRELRNMLEEHQSALEVIMNKYRQQVRRLIQAKKAELAWVSRDDSQELQQKADKVSEMAAIMKKAVEIDDDNYVKEQERLLQLVTENKLLRELLKIKHLSPQDNNVHNRIDECVQTDS